MLILTLPMPFSAPASTFQPTDLAGLKGWWKADTITGLADGSPLVQWNDSSGNGYHMAANSSSRRPLYRASGGASNKPYVEFSGAHAIGANISGTPPWTWFFVLYWNDLWTSGPRIWENDFTADATRDARTRSTASGPGSYVGASTGYSFSSTTLPPVQTWIILSSRFSATNAHMRWNDQPLRTSALDMSAFTPGTVVFGASSLNGGNGAPMWLAEAVLYEGTIPTDQEEAEVIGYLNSKYGAY